MISGTDDMARGIATRLPAGGQAFTLRSASTIKARLRAIDAGPLAHGGRSTNRRMALQEPVGTRFDGAVRFLE